MSTIKIAWRNLLRNKRRTAITVVAVAINTAILIGTLALMEGMRRQMVRSATRLLVGDAQVHAEGYRQDRSMYKALKHPEEIIAAAKSNGIVAAPRSYGFGLLSQGTKSAGATFVGIDPEAEQKAFELPQKIQKGTFVPREGKHNVVIGQKLAKSLDADVGSELIAVVQAADGSLGNELFTVAGIFQIVGEEIDRGSIFMHREDFEELFVSQGRVHEIAFNGQGKTPEAVVSALKAAIGTDAGTEIKNWHELLPMISEMVNMSGAFIALFAIVFFLVAGVGVLNTMLMATYDRVREFGVLKALGATPWRIIREVTSEGFILALVSTAIGGVIGVLMGLYFENVGIDLTNVTDASVSFAGVAWDPLWRGFMLPRDIAGAVLAMWVSCVLASLYPAIKAARLNPVEAMTHY